MLSSRGGEASSARERPEREGNSSSGRIPKEGEQKNRVKGFCPIQTRV